MKKQGVTLALLSLWIVQTQSQDFNCDFFRNVVPGNVYNISSPRYPLNYPAGVQCRWVARCPANYNCRLDCPYINLPQTASCAQDRILISRSGDPQLASAEYYCGQGTLNGVTSTGQQLSIGLITSNNSPGGRFTCQVSAQPAGNTQDCSCGYKRSNRIVNGEVTRVNEYPMMAGIVYAELREIKCGGTIISVKHVITAAHCVVQRSTSDTGVVVGEHDVTTGAETSATQGFSLETIRSHPQYSESTQDYDIAILTVVGTITFSDLVGPACLPFKFSSSSFTGQNVTLLGWGTDSFGGITSDQLKKVEVGVISQSECQRSYSTLTPRQMCTYRLGRDSCQDDSGGPALYLDSSTGRLFHVGIISLGRGCATRNPGINARVTALLDWIVANTPSVTLCRVA